MKKFTLALMALVLIAGAASAQKVSGVVKGILQDSTSSTPLADATVSVVRIQDSALISFTLTGPKGDFEIRNLEPGEYSLLSSFSGLQTLRRRFAVTAARPVADLGVVGMARSYKTLDEVVITEAPVKVNGDTIAYKADAFKTKPNATVEDLLKKLPGVQVERDGTVKAQGEQVQKVYVDGKEFFNNDPKMATKNLTADMVDQVEVYDDMSEQAKFSKIDDGSRTKAINLKLKKDKKKGLFGKAYAGYGTQERFDMGLNANLFNGSMQTSVVAKNNNTNNLGFTFSDMMGMFGSGGGGMMSGGGGGGMMGNMTMTAGRGGGGSFGGLNLGNSGSGITKSSVVGLNYRDTWSKSFDVNGSYNFNHINTDNDRQSYMRSFFSDTTLLTDDRTISKAENDNHRMNLNLMYTIDSLNSVIYTPNFNYQKTFNTYSLDSFSIRNAVKNGVNYLTNEGRTYNTSSGEGYSWSNNLIWRHRFRRPGRTLSVNLSNTWGSNKRDNSTETQSKFYAPNGTLVRNLNTNSLYTTDSRTNNYAASLSYTEPWGRDKVLELNYNHTRNGNESDREIFNPHAGTGEFERVDSNYLRNNNSWDRLGLNLRVVKKKYNYQLGMAVQQTTIESNNLAKPGVVKQTFTNLLPTANFQYQFARNKSLRFNYRGSTRQPGVNQLQDLIDSTNFRNKYQGNPGLAQEFTNNFVLSYNFFDIIKFRNLFAFVSFSNTYDKIANAVTRFPNGTQFTRPVNVDGAYNLSGTINLGFPIQKLKGGNFNTNSRVSYGRDVNLINNVKSYTDNLTLGEDLRLSYNYKEKLDMGIGVSTSYTEVKYTDTASARNNTNYYTHVFSADITYTFPLGIMLNTEVDYTLNTGRTDGFNQNFLLWNAYLAKEVFKNKRGEVRLSVNDILSQNQGITRNTGTNYVEDVRSSVLQRFFMFTFTYRLNRMGGRTIPAVLERATRGVRMVPN